MANPIQEIRTTGMAHRRSKGIAKTVLKPRQTASPFQTIAAEILKPIFMWLRQEMYFVALDPEQASRLDSSWLYVSHVCRNWREAALSSPLLWTTIVCKPSTEVAMMLAFFDRSLDMPLRVGIVEPLAKPQHLLALVSQGFRIELCAMHFRDGPKSKLLRDFLSYLLAIGSRLEVLHLSGKASIELPGISQQTPSLRTLICATISLSWDSTVLSGLETLVLDAPQHPPSLAQLIGILSRCQLLRSFDLHLTTALVFEDYVPGHVPEIHIKLAYLQSARICCVKETDILSVLAYLEFPDTVTLTLVICCPRRSQAARFPKSSCQSFKRALARVVRVIVSGRRIDADPGQDQWPRYLKGIEGYSADGRRTLQVGWTWASTRSYASLPIYVDGLQFPALRDLTVRETIMAEDEWLGWCVGAPGLKSLRLVPSGAYEDVSQEALHQYCCLCMLRMRVDRVPMWPMLDTLALEASLLTERWFPGILDDCCFVRARFGVPITKLRIWCRDGEGVELSDLMMLEKVVTVQVQKITAGYDVSNLLHSES